MVRKDRGGEQYSTVNKSARGSRMVLWAVIAAGAVALVAVGSRVRDRDSRVFRAASLSLGAFLPAPRPSESVRFPFVEQFSGGRLSDAWRWRERDALYVKVDGGSLIADASRESVWWMNKRGPFVHLPIAGNVEIVSHVRVRRASDPMLAPDREWQFAGLMLRSDIGDRPLSLENYVFVVIGHRGSSLQAEFKSTRNGDSDVGSVPWPDGDAELRLVRSGATITAEIRTPGDSLWHVLKEYHRPDLPLELQAGLIVYAYSEGRGVFDLRAMFSSVVVQLPASE